MKNIVMKGNFKNADSLFGTDDFFTRKVADLHTALGLAAKRRLIPFALCLWTAPYGEVSDLGATISG